VLFRSRHIIIPALNEKDLSEIPEELCKQMTFEPVESMDQVIALALSGDGGSGQTKTP
jgi:ATP-dependent Lon protease